MPRVEHRIAQLNLARAVGPLDSPTLAEFIATGCASRNTFSA
jgi:hypothetical protein